MSLRERVLQLKDRGLGRTRIVKELSEDGIDITEWKVRTILLSENNLEMTTNADGSITLQEETPDVDPESLLAGANLDADEWGVDEIRQWDVQTQKGVRKFTSARFKPKTAETQLGQFRDQLLADIRKAAPSRPAKEHTVGNHLLEVAIFDIHAGKITRAVETGKEYNLERTLRAFEWALDDLIAKSKGFPIERFLFPIGNDLLHHELQGTTTRGTQVGDRDQWLYVFQATRKTLELAVEKMLHYAPVDIVIVAGNHDTQSTLSMGEVMDARFWNYPDVTVDNQPKPRKYYEYGKCLIGFTHGHFEKSLNDLPLLMASEEPEKWARTVFREFHTGHGHRKKSSERLPSDEVRGVRLRQIPSLDGTDAWHNNKGYESLSAAEAYLWHKEAGNTAQFFANVPLALYE